MNKFNVCSFWSCAFLFNASITRTNSSAGKFASDNLCNLQNVPVDGGGGGWGVRGDYFGESESAQMFAFIPRQSVNSCIDYVYSVRR